MNAAKLALIYFGFAFSVIFCAALFGEFDPPWLASVMIASAIVLYWLMWKFLRTEFPR